jgi:hypothetical protein
MSTPATPHNLQPGQQLGAYVVGQVTEEKVQLIDTTLDRSQPWAKHYSASKWLKHDSPVLARIIARA